MTIDAGTIIIIVLVLDILFIAFYLKIRGISNEEIYLFNSCSC